MARSTARIKHTTARRKMLPLAGHPLVAARVDELVEKVVEELQRWGVEVRPTT